MTDERSRSSLPPRGTSMRAITPPGHTVRITLRFDVPPERAELIFPRHEPFDLETATRCGVVSEEGYLTAKGYEMLRQAA